MIFAAVTFIAIGTIKGNRNNFTNSMDMDKKELSFNETRHINDDTVEYVFDVSKIEVECPCIEFYTNHQYVEVFADGKMIYNFGENKSVYGNSPGSLLHFVDYPDESEEVLVRITAAYPEVQGRDYEFYLGYGIKDYRNAIQKSLGAATISLIIVLIGLGIIAYWIVFHRKVNDGPTVLHFGGATMIIGLWCLNETDLVMLVAANHTIASYISYMFLMMLPIPIVNFYRKFLQLEDQVVCGLIGFISIANFFICTYCHMSGIAYFKETVLFTHIVLAFSIIYVIYGVASYFMQFGMDKFIITNIVAVCVVIISFSFDMFSYYIGFQRTDVLGKIGILVYIILMAILNMKNFSQQIEDGKKVEMYREMAVRDGLTGLYNRAAFEEWMNETNDFNDVMIVMMDLNDLKECNDTYGHIEGDKYLINSANLISRNFGEIGKCYRLGGDEFCVIVPKASSVHIENFLKRMERKESDINKFNKKQKLAIAYGVAVFNDRDNSFADTYKRADDNMYEKKSMMKRA